MKITTQEVEDSSNEAPEVVGQTPAKTKDPLLLCDRPLKLEEVTE